MAHTILETGVDRLAQLVHASGKITVADAAKQLGVSQEVIIERAHMLDDALVELEYKFFKPYLVAKKITKKELACKEKEFCSKQHHFVRKAEGALNFLSNEKKQFNTIKKEFTKLKRDLGVDIDAMHKKVGDIKKYTALTDTLDKSIARSTERIASLQEYADKVQKTVDMEKKVLVAAVDAAKKQRAELVSMQQAEQSLHKLLDFMNTKMESYIMVDKMVKHRVGLEKSLTILIKKAKAVDVSRRSVHIGAQLQELNSEFEKLEEKRSFYSRGLDKIARIQRTKSTA